jgi:hypothetical protein
MGGGAGGSLIIEDDEGSTRSVGIDGTATTFDEGEDLS